MPSALLQKIDAANARVSVLLRETRGALAGQGDFGVQQVRALSEPIQQMAPILRQAAELRAENPEIASALDLYKMQLVELQTALDQVRVMLLAKRGQMEAGRVQLDAVAQWAAALRRTQ